MNREKSEVLCTDTCEHCLYVETGDFFCDIQKKLTIVDWTPTKYPCPNKRSVYDTE